MLPISRGGHLRDLCWLSVGMGIVFLNKWNFWKWSKCSVEKGVVQKKIMNDGLKKLIRNEEMIGFQKQTKKKQKKNNSKSLKQT